MPIINMVYKKKWKWKPNASRTIFYFDFENNLNDTSGNSHNPTGSSWIWYTQVWWQYVVTNTSAYPYIQLNTSYWNNLSDFTIAFWIYPIKPNNWYYPMLFGSYNNSSPYSWPTIFYNEGNNNWITMRMSGNNQHYPFSLAVQTWQHIVFTRSSGVCKAYLNWVLKETWNDTTTRNSQSFYIFSRWDYQQQSFTSAGAKWDKYIYENVWWTDTEVSDYYNQTKHIYEDNIDNYQEVEYIENTSNWPRIDTGVIPTQNIKSQIKFRNFSVTGDVIYWMSNWDDNSDYRFFNASSKIYWDISSSRLEGSTCNTNTDYEFELWNNYVKNVWASTNILSWSTVASYTWTATIKLNYWGTPSRNRWYYVKIYDGSTLVRDLVPCYRKDDSVIWMFDLVNKKFYTNSWSWTFTKWPDVN